MEHPPYDNDPTQPDPGAEQPAPATDQRPAPRRAGAGRTLLTAGVAAAVFGAGGLGLGLLVAPRDAGSSTGSSPSASAFANGYGDDLPSIGGWSAQGTPWTGRGQVPQTTETDQGTRSASSAEVSGLVRIRTTINFGQGEAAGTGMVLTPDGEVVTNHHVVQGATSIEATVMTTRKTYQADLVGTDATADVAVLRLQGASDLATVTTDTGAVRTGDTVTAVGDAGGSDSTFTAAPGTISATDQHITTESDGLGTGEALSGLLQMPPAVAPGDSGGATYDKGGDVVGMTTAASSGGGNVDGYAIPIGTVLSIADDLTRHVAGSHYAYGHPAFPGGALADGTTVQQVYAGTAATSAGIVAGDRITGLGSTRTPTATTLRQAVRSHQPGDRVGVSWTDRTGHVHTATVTLGSGPVA
jgi:S1-C subfamily serine protease